jgi:hypothetical protein
MTTHEIKTFSQALPILDAHGKTPVSIGGKLWKVGAMQYDKGGIVALARELVAMAPAAPILSPQMQTYAQGYIDARKRAGDALLDQARFLALARDAAQYGEWGVFLEATQTSEDWAGRLLNIHDTAERDPKFAAAIRSNFLNLSTAYELSSAPADLRDRLLEAAEAPLTVKSIRDEKRAANSATSRSLGPGQPAPEPWPEAPDDWRWNRRGAPAHLIAPGGWRTADYNYPDRALAEAQQYMLTLSPFWQSIDAHHPTAHLWTRERPDLLRSACGMTIQNRLPSGSTEAGHCSSCVRATWPQNQSAINRPDGSPLSEDRALPGDLRGWHWMSGKAGTFQLTNGDYQTRVYDHPHHAIVGARNYLESQRPDPAHVERLEEQIESADPIPEARMLIGDEAQIAEIRAKAAALGLGVIWEDDTVILHWPDEDIEQLMGMGYQDALYWLSAEGRTMAEDRAAKQATPAPDDHGASDRAAYEALEAADRDLLFTAEANIKVGNYADSRALLDQVQVSTYARDQLRTKMVRASALAFHNDQRARLKNFSAAAMISQATFTQALDHLSALLMELPE